MLRRLLEKLETAKGKNSKRKQNNQHDIGVLKKSQFCHADGKLSKTYCKCDPTACKCDKKKQGDYQRLLLSQLRRRGADNLSSVILF
ncbi:uncharacterized protein LOC6566529 isoform X2 [Drosophila grimshawi]|uniref:uncharacterized protein LOC6566529 isoform X2 n=1 Tax=Drosophila grimshawi TaxID=7222 RepID=UPI000C86F364|nr:uncharacterized protein LOC6566529 isoform X2 [Drosophila grimshawi]